MKTKLIFILFALLGQISTAMAANKLPSNSQVKKYIKARIEKQSSFKVLSGFEWKGFDETPFCEKPSVSSIKILKRGKAFNSYEGRSGSFIDTWFKVKFLVKGSCKLSAPAQVDKKWIYKGGESYQKAIVGRVPFRQIPVEAIISTDSYGDWECERINVIESEYGDEGREKRMAYRQQLYIKRNRGLLYETGDSFHGVKGKLVDPKKALQTTARSATGSVNKSSTRTKNSTGLTSSEKRQKLKAIKEMQTFLATHPKIHKALNTQSKASLEALFKRLVNIPNKERRNKEFYHVYSQLKHRQTRRASNRSPQKRSASQKHSHGGRYHTHKLPPQGIAHRHRNGPIGR